MKINKALYICLPLMGAALTGCESDVSLKDAIAPKGGLLKIVAPTLVSEESGASELPATTDIYEFADGVFLRSQSVNPAEDSISVTGDTSLKVFCVSGANVGALGSSTTLEDFLAATVKSPDGAQSAPMFYAGASDVNPGDEEMTLELRRGVARIDLACEDPRVVISEVVVDNAPASSLIIEGETPLADAGTVTYTYKVGEDFDGYLSQVFTVFESAEPVTVRVKGTFDGDRMNFSTTIPSISRNKVYTLGVSGGSDMNATIDIADWQSGDSGDGALNLGEMAISREYSVIPEDVKINEANNDITFPSTGVKDMKLAFLTKEPLKLGNVLGELQGITITAAEPKAVDEGYVSTFNINVAAQPKCGEAYDATVVFYGANNFYINLDVEASPYQIPTVYIAGRHWMCFNAVTGNVDDEVYLKEGDDVEDMYNNHYIDYIGNFFQYGKENAFNPFTSNDPNKFAEQTRDVPWRTVGRMPLPKGFHVPTIAEWASLVPNNTTLPASYRTASGDSIKATVVTLPGTLDNTPSASTNAQNYLKRYILFESVTSGAKLYLPLAGIKANANHEIPTQQKFRFDNRSAYWMQEERYIQLLDYKAQADGSDGALLQSNRWNADGFVMVRGIKD